MSEEEKVTNSHATETDEKTLKLALAESYITMQDKKMLVLRQEIDQYLKDLTMWKTTTGSEYATRRFEEVQERLKQIEQ